MATLPDYTPLAAYENSPRSFHAVRRAEQWALDAEKAYVASVGDAGEMAAIATAWAAIAAAYESGGPS